VGRGFSLLPEALLIDMFSWRRALLLLEVGSGPTFSVSLPHKLTRSDASSMHLRRHSEAVLRRVWSLGFAGG
jgi:hypothetical protein